MQMVSLLEPIAFEVISSMSRLLDFYLNAVSVVTYILYTTGVCWIVHELYAILFL